MRLSLEISKRNTKEHPKQPKEHATRTNATSTNRKGTQRNTKEHEQKIPQNTEYPMNGTDLYTPDEYTPDEWQEENDEWNEPTKPQTKRLTLHLTAEQIKALKIQAIETDQTVSAYVADMCMI